MDIVGGGVGGVRRRYVKSMEDKMNPNAHVGMVLTPVKNGEVPCRAKCRICGKEYPYYKTDDGYYVRCPLHGFIKLEKRK